MHERHGVLLQPLCVRGGDTFETWAAAGAKTVPQCLRNLGDSCGSDSECCGGGGDGRWDGGVRCSSQTSSCCASTATTTSADGGACGTDGGGCSYCTTTDDCCDFMDASSEGVVCVSTSDEATFAGVTVASGYGRCIRCVDFGLVVIEGEGEVCCGCRISDAADSCIREDGEDGSSRVTCCMENGLSCSSNSECCTGYCDAVTATCNATPSGAADDFVRGGLFYMGVARQTDLGNSRSFATSYENNTMKSGQAPLWQLAFSPFQRSNVSSDGDGTTVSSSPLNAMYVVARNGLRGAPLSGGSNKTTSPEFPEPLTDCMLFGFVPLSSYLTTYGDANKSAVDPLDFLLVARVPWTKKYVWLIRVYHKVDTEYSEGTTYHDASDSYMNRVYATSNYSGWKAYPYLSTDWKSIFSRVTLHMEDFVVRIMKNDTVNVTRDFVKNDDGGSFGFVAQENSTKDLGGSTTSFTGPDDAAYYYELFTPYAPAGDTESQECYVRAGTDTKGETHAALHGIGFASRFGPGPILSSWMQYNTASDLMCTNSVKRTTLTVPSPADTTYPHTTNFYQCSLPDNYTDEVFGNKKDLCPYRNMVAYGDACFWNGSANEVCTSDYACLYLGSSVPPIAPCGVDGKCPAPTSVTDTYTFSMTTEFGVPAAEKSVTKKDIGNVYQTDSVFSGPGSKAAKETGMLCGKPWTASVDTSSGTPTIVPILDTTFAKTVFYLMPYGIVQTDDATAHATACPLLFDPDPRGTLYPTQAIGVDGLIDYPFRYDTTSTDYERDPTMVDGGRDGDWITGSSATALDLNVLQSENFAFKLATATDMVDHAAGNEGPVSAIHYCTTCAQASNNNEAAYTSGQDEHFYVGYQPWPRLSSSAENNTKYFSADMSHQMDFRDSMSRFYSYEKVKLIYDPDTDPKDTMIYPSFIPALREVDDTSTVLSTYKRSMITVPPKMIWTHRDALHQPTAVALTEAQGSTVLLSGPSTAEQVEVADAGDGCGSVTSSTGCSNTWADTGGGAITPCTLASSDFGYPYCDSTGMTSDPAACGEESIFHPFTSSYYTSTVLCASNYQASTNYFAGVSEVSAAKGNDLAILTTAASHDRDASAALWLAQTLMYRVEAIFKLSDTRSLDKLWYQCSSSAGCSAVSSAFPNRSIYLQPHIRQSDVITDLTGGSFDLDADWSEIQFQRKYNRLFNWSSVLVLDAHSSGYGSTTTPLVEASCANTKDHNISKLMTKSGTIDGTNYDRDGRAAAFATGYFSRTYNEPFLWYDTLQTTYTKWTSNKEAVISSFLGALNPYQDFIENGVGASFTKYDACGSEELSSGNQMNCAFSYFHEETSAPEASTALPSYVSNYNVNGLRSTVDPEYAKPKIQDVVASRLYRSATSLTDMEGGCVKTGDTPLGDGTICCSLQDPDDDTGLCTCVGRNEPCSVNANCCQSANTDAIDVCVNGVCCTGTEMNDDNQIIIRMPTQGEGMSYSYPTSD